MPTRYWLPLHGLEGPAPVEHVHAALSSWFDGDEGSVGHHDNEKPYTISPTALHGDSWGVQVAVVDPQVERTLILRSRVGTKVRLGRQFVVCGSAEPVLSLSWEQLAEYDGSTGWEVEFVTPFFVRTKNRSSPFPAPAAVLRSPTELWRHFSAGRPIDLPVRQHSAIWVSRIDVRTEIVSVNGRKHPGLLGKVSYRCTDEAAAPSVSTLLRFAAFSGTGSMRGKGMGFVNVRPF